MITEHMKNENLKNLIVLVLAACMIAAIGFGVVKAAVNFDWPQPTRTPELREPVSPPTYREPNISDEANSFMKKEPVYR